MSLKHKDNRRSLYEYQYPVTKVLVFHKDCVAGDHYHKQHDEVFILLKGKATAIIGGVRMPMHLMESIGVLRGIHHLFEVSKDSILLELATQAYDPNDDYK